MHLLKRESERKEAFRRADGKTSREAVATEDGDLGGISRKSLMVLSLDESCAESVD